MCTILSTLAIAGSNIKEEQIELNWMITLMKIDEIKLPAEQKLKQ